MDILCETTNSVWVVWVGMKETNCLRAYAEPMPILDLTKLSSPNEIFNVTLVIKDKKLRVSKNYLAIHSPFFSPMFFGESAEKGKDEVEIKDVRYEDFIDLLHVIYSSRKKITDSTARRMLILSDCFQMENIRDEAEKHIILCTNNYFNSEQKLEIADQYNLRKLKISCLESYTDVHMIGNLKLTSEYADFSYKMKAAICDRLMEVLNVN